MIKDIERFKGLLQELGLETGYNGSTQLMIKCPFHPDTKPSLSISLEKEIAHCFGCGVSGTLTAILKKYCDKRKIDWLTVKQKLSEISEKTELEILRNGNNSYTAFYNEKKNLIALVMPYQKVGFLQIYLYDFFFQNGKLHSHINIHYWHPKFLKDPRKIDGLTYHTVIIIDKKIISKILAKYFSKHKMLTEKIWYLIQSNIDKIKNYLKIK